MCQVSGSKARCRTALLVVGLILACFSGMLYAAGTELNCMVFTYGAWDYEVKDGASDCMKVVETAKERCGGTRLAFVNTHFWVDETGDGVDYYCYRNTHENGCERVTPAMVQAFTNGMAQCFAKAVSLGFDIEITPHIDDGLGKGGWRNALVFDPNVKYGEMSYTDIMIKPLADALGKAVKPDTKVWFATQGEMSATVMRHPQSWKELIPQIKQWVGGQDPASQKRVKVGVSTNFNKLCACVLMDLVDPTEYLRKLPAALEPIIGEFDIPAITALYDEVDFIGISSYASMPADFTDKDLENAALQFSEEAINFGVNLTALITEKGKELHYSEYGVGGGTCNTGDCPATTPDEAAKTPFFGIFGAYSTSTDPWQKPALKQWLRGFYQRTAQWLAKKGGPTFRVDGLYLWNLASWDAVGISTSSTSAEGSYYDAEISQTILQHNKAVAAAAADSPADTITPTKTTASLHADNETTVPHATITSPKIVIPDVETPAKPTPTPSPKAAKPTSPLFPTEPTTETDTAVSPIFPTKPASAPLPTADDAASITLTKAGKAASVALPETTSPSPNAHDRLSSAGIYVEATGKNIPSPELDKADKVVAAGLEVLVASPPPVEEEEDNSGFVEKVNPIDMSTLISPIEGDADTEDGAAEIGQSPAVIDTVAAKRAEEGEGTPMDSDPANKIEKALVGEKADKNKQEVYEEIKKKHRKQIERVEKKAEQAEEGGR